MLFCANQNHWVVGPCLADGNKVRQVFTNLLSSSLFSPLQDHSLFEQYATKLNVSHMLEMPPRKALLPLIWLKRGKRARDTVFISTVAGTPD